MVTEIPYLSLGAGVQSSTLIRMLEDNALPLAPSTPRIAIFADTGAEPPDVYEHLDWLESKASAIEIVRVQHSNLHADAMNGVNHQGRRYGGGGLPAYVLNNDGTKGIRKRECTTAYKIVPIEREMRRRFGRPYPGGKQFIAWTGISMDEVIRMKDDPRKSYTRRYPLIEMGMTRDDCVQWWSQNYPDKSLPRSACWFCPFHKGEEWVRLVDKFPELGEKLTTLDEKIRDDAITGDRVHSRFLHRRVIPIMEAIAMDRRAIEAREAQQSLWGNFGDECEGVCGV